MRLYALVLILFSFNASANDSHNIELGVLLLVVGGNFDYEYKISDRITIGPSLYAWNGGKGRSSSSDGNDDYSFEPRYAYGLKSTFYLNTVLESGFYGSVGLYSLTLVAQGERNSIGYSGDSRFFHIDLLGGYFWKFQSGFNISLGLGGGYTPNYKPITISDDNGFQRSEDVSIKTPFIGELNVGWAF